MVRQFRHCHPAAHTLAFNLCCGVLHQGPTYPPTHSKSAAMQTPRHGQAAKDNTVYGWQQVQHMKTSYNQWHAGWRMYYRVLHELKCTVLQQFGHACWPPTDVRKRAVQQRQPVVCACIPHRNTP